MAPLIGVPFGACFEAGEEVGGGGQPATLVRAAPRLAATAAEWDAWTEGGGADVTRTNQDLTDASNANQALTAADVEALRAAGARGDAVVDALAAGSATYAAKSELSQAKWRARKTKKHALAVRLVRPSAAAIASYFWRARPASLGCLRPNGVALAMHLGGVAAGGRVLAVDGVRGVLAAAAAERVGGVGVVVVAGVGRGAPPLDALKAVRLSVEARDAVFLASLAELAGARADAAAGPADAAGEPAAKRAKADAAPSHPTTARADRRATARAAAVAGFDAAVVAAPTADPSSLLDAILPLLLPGAAFCIHSPHLPPLATAAADARRRGDCCDVSVAEPWWREIQVLPRRTHPAMAMSGCGGYLMWGVRVEEKVAVPVVAGADGAADGVAAADGPAAAAAAAEAAYDAEFSD